MIRINPLFFIVLFIAYKFNILVEFLIVFLISLSHESGHLICALLTKQKIESITIYPWGICLKCEKISSLKLEFLISAAGPAVNLIYIVLAMIIKNQFFFSANLFMMIINLLPIYPLDGGRIFSSFLRNELNHTLADKILRYTSSFLAIIVLLTGMYLFLKTKINFSVILAALFISFTTEKSVYTSSEYSINSIKHFAVKDTDKAGLLLKCKSKDENIIIDILGENRSYLGSVSGRDVLEEIALNGYEIKFGEILRKHLLY